MLPGAPWAGERRGEHTGASEADADPGPEVCKHEAHHWDQADTEAAGNYINCWFSPGWPWNIWCMLGLERFPAPKWPMIYSQIFCLSDWAITIQLVSLCSVLISIFFIISVLNYPNNFNNKFITLFLAHIFTTTKSLQSECLVIMKN